MRLDPAAVAAHTRSFAPQAYLRTTPWEYRATPLGMGFGRTRFASPTRAFKLLYIAEDLPTSIAEAIVRDRFEGAIDRELTRGELADWGVCEVDSVKPLRVLDLRGSGCFDLGVSTDIVGAKAQDLARIFSQAVYDTTDLDGILYRSRLRPRKNCVAVFDRAVSTSLQAGSVCELERLDTLVQSLRTLKIKLLA